LKKLIRIALSREKEAGRDGAVSAAYEDNYRTRIYAGHIIQAKPSKVYYEKWSRKMETGIEYFYKAWVLVPFSQSQYNDMWEQVLSQANTQIEEYVEMFFTADLIPSSVKHLFNIITYVIETENDLQNTMLLLNLPSYQKFLKLKRELLIFVESAVRDIKIHDLDSTQKIRDELRFYVTYRKMAMPQFPLYIVAPDLGIDISLVTDGHGKVVIPFQYKNKRDALVSVRHGAKVMQKILGKTLSATEIVLPSPLNASNIYWN